MLRLGLVLRAERNFSEKLRDATFLFFQFLSAITPSFPLMSIGIAVVGVVAFNLTLSIVSIVSIKLL